MFQSFSYCKNQPAQKSNVLSPRKRCDGCKRVKFYDGTLAVVSLTFRPTSLPPFCVPIEQQQIAAAAPGIERSCWG